MVAYLDAMYSTWEEERKDGGKPHTPCPPSPPPRPLVLLLQTSPHPLLSPACNLHCRVTW